MRAYICWYAHASGWLWNWRLKKYMCHWRPTKIIKVISLHIACTHIVRFASFSLLLLLHLFLSLCRFFSRSLRLSSRQSCVCRSHGHFDRFYRFELLSFNASIGEMAFVYEKCVSFVSVLSFVWFVFFFMIRWTSKNDFPTKFSVPIFLWSTVAEASSLFNRLTIECWQKKNMNPTTRTQHTLERFRWSNNTISLSVENYDIGNHIDFHFNVKSSLSFWSNYGMNIKKKETEKNRSKKNGTKERERKKRRKNMILVLSTFWIFLLFLSSFILKMSMSMRVVSFTFDFGFILFFHFLSLWFRVEIENSKVRNSSKRNSFLSTLTMNITHFVPLFNIFRFIFLLWFPHSYCRSQTEFPKLNGWGKIERKKKTFVKMRI